MLSVLTSHSVKALCEESTNGEVEDRTDNMPSYLCNIGGESLAEKHCFAMKTLKFLTLEAISKCSIGLKIKAGRNGQPQTYIEYFEDWTLRPNADIEFEGTF